ncbi:GAF domain-containing sensor histidine kinase [Bogoriella caseilytica]|uniref:Histidine kinase/DNA gyrase B/HSP90-like ATPase n=1 Tax=Bogoriella caseilytica TaxID=56055 RepID=A0A3N2B9P1_9MICO|nr:GAF domain-containing sensor histidine kinase [Bogoriella caseilytica]ROR71976.1 histidine kinase/DNA gyrase B/HSP90-like ATPase [Bogoriella caseilytica]
MANAYGRHGRERQDHDRLQPLLEAVVSIGSDLDLPAVLDRIVSAARVLADCQYAALGVIGEDGQLSEFVAHGMTDEEVAELEATVGRPHGQGLLGLLVSRPQTLRLADMTTHLEYFGLPAGHPPMRRFLGVPIRLRNEVFGNLYLAEKNGGAEFGSEDEQIIEALATAAGIAVENARLFSESQERERYGVIEDRLRIARDLHDVVIQQLYAAAMSLAAVTHQIDQPAAATQVNGVVDLLDDTVRQIRSTIFALQPQPNEEGLRARVMSVVRDASGPLGLTPSMELTGLLDTDVAAGPSEDAVAVLREALSNAARHARATRVDVRVSLSEGDLTVQVFDNGVGFSPGARRSGLANLEARAERLGGSFEIGPGGSGQGTTLTWRVPAL